MSTTTRRSASEDRRFTRRFAVPTALALTLVLSSIGMVAAAPVSATGCETSWGSIPKLDDRRTPGSVTGVRAGRHPCFDRIVVDLDGARPGYHVDYVDSLDAEGMGDIVSLDGGAIIRVIVHAPAYDDIGSATVDPAAVSATNVAGYRTFRDVEWAGSFEAHTLIGLGVRARLPFRVFTLDGPGSGSRLVVDVAHSWNTPPPSDDRFPGRPGVELAVIGVAHDDVLNMRSGPGINRRVVARLAPTDSVFATGKAKMLTRSIWYEVSTQDGTKGWVNAFYLSRPGAVDDVTAAYLAEHPRPSAISMIDLGAEVAANFLPDAQGSYIVMSVAPTVGDLGEVTYDVVGLADDSVRSLRLHIFAEPLDTGDGFELRTIESQFFCIRGFDGTNCI